MTQRESGWMTGVLGIQSPWHITEVKWGANTSVVSVLVEMEESVSRFWPLRKSRPIVRRLRWDHLSLAGYRCELVVSLREGQNPPDALWTGEGNAPFTRGLARLVMDELLEGATVPQLSRMLGLPFADLWKYKFRLDQGSARPPQATAARPGTAANSPAPATPVPAASTASSTPPASAAAPNPPPPSSAASSPATAAKASASASPPSGAVPSAPAAVPPESSAVWPALLSGSFTLDVQTLSLKLLLAKMQRDAKAHQDADLHRQAALALRRYFERNQSLLVPEVAQLAAAHQATQARSAAGGAASALPDVSDPLWLDLLMGQRELEVRTLSLRLLLSKLRSQAQALQDDEVRMLKLVELRRFFEKNQAALRHEITQIQRWSAH